MLNNNISQMPKPTRRWYKRWWAIVLFVIFAMILVFAPFYLYQVNKIYKEIKSGSYLSLDFNDKAPYDMKLLIDEQLPWIGAKDAKIKIVEFGDFNCSVCLKQYPELRKLVTKYPNDVKIYWRNYAVREMSSIDLAMAGECANDQKLFWAFHDYAFNKQGTLNLLTLSSDLHEIGIDKEKFEKCLDHTLTSAQIKKDQYLADDFKVQGTPTFIINGYKLEGYIPFEGWESLVEKMLTRNVIN